jgi:hypothetical protein
MIMFSVWDFIIFIISLISILLFWLIAKKAGYSGWWVLTMIIPLVNLIMVWAFAFAEWPVEHGPPRVTSTWKKVLGYIFVSIMILGLIGIVLAITVPMIVSQ